MNAGIRSEVWVLVTTDSSAHANISNFLAAGTKVIGQDKADAGPDKLYLGGIEARLLRFGNAGNAAVYFPNLRVLAVGGLLNQQSAAERGATLDREETPRDKRKK
jgi:hypothetical protein